LSSIPERQRKKVRRTESRGQSPVLEERSFPSVFEDLKAIVDIHTRGESGGHEVSDARR
jgi:hypothetical protein